MMDKRLAKVTNLWKKFKSQITKEPARDICALAKVKVIRTNEYLLLQVQTNKTPFTAHQQYTH